VTKSQVILQKVVDNAIDPKSLYAILYRMPVVNPNLVVVDLSHPLGQRVAWTLDIAKEIFSAFSNDLDKNMLLRFRLTRYIQGDTAQGIFYENLWQMWCRSKENIKSSFYQLIAMKVSPKLIIDDHEKLIIKSLPNLTPEHFDVIITYCETHFTELQELFVSTRVTSPLQEIIKNPIVPDLAIALWIKRTPDAELDWTPANFTNPPLPSFGPVLTHVSTLQLLIDTKRCHTETSRLLRSPRAMFVNPYAVKCNMWLEVWLEDSLNAAKGTYTLARHNIKKQLTDLDFLLPPLVLIVMTFYG